MQFFTRFLHFQLQFFHNFTQPRVLCINYISIWHSCMRLALNKLSSFFFFSKLPPKVEKNWDSVILFKQNRGKFHFLRNNFVSFFFLLNYFNFNMILFEFRWHMYVEYYGKYVYHDIWNIIYLCPLDIIKKLCSHMFNFYQINLMTLCDDFRFVWGIKQPFFF